MWKSQKAEIYILILTAMFLFRVPSSIAIDLQFVNEHWPPFIILEKSSQASGIDVELISELAGRLGLGVEVNQCDWYYCLELMKTGRADILSSLLKRQDREKYMYYIEPPYIQKSIKLFYIPKEKAHLIQRYNDLYRLTIGVLKGSAYFSPFDKDAKIYKVEVLKTEQLLAMLKDGRIDAFIGTEIVTDYLIRSLSFENLFSKSVYRYESKAPYHMAISKKSPYAKKITEFNKAMAQMVNEGRVQVIIDKYGGENR